MQTINNLTLFFSTKIFGNILAKKYDLLIGHISSSVSMMSSLYYANTLSWIFIVLAHRNNSPRHIILILIQPVVCLSP